MDQSFQQRLTRAALAFRGYNTTNLGRTPELLAVPSYSAIVSKRLAQISQVASDELKRPVDLVDRVSRRLPSGLEDYADSIALVYATELAQIDLLREAHGVDIGVAQLAYGYSLGEVVAMAASGMLPQADAIRAPLAMAEDCAALAHDVTMGVVFSRRMALSEIETHRLCAAITSEQKGTIGVSAVLSPNTLLVLGQGDTIHRFQEEMGILSPSRVFLRLNDHRWPPLHTPIVRQRCVPDRASVMMQTMTADATATLPPVFSLASGTMAASQPSIHELLRNWVDRPQRLWDAVCLTLSSGVQCVIHIGPEPNVIPATFQRLSDNVHHLTDDTSISGLGMRALRHMADRPWLSAILPQRASLLRAPRIEHIILEDWLLENAPK
jgi:[acyl-carrier-protein] S-malonyltransferase